MAVLSVYPARAAHGDAAYCLSARRQRQRERSQPYHGGRRLSEIAADWYIGRCAGVCSDPAAVRRNGGMGQCRKGGAQPDRDDGDTIRHRQKQYIPDRTQHGRDGNMEHSGGVSHAFCACRAVVRQRYQHKERSGKAEKCAGAGICRLCGQNRRSRLQRRWRRLCRRSAGMLLSRCLTGRIIFPCRGSPIWILPLIW